MRDFYTTMAQVFPVLLLGLIWESSFLGRLPTQNRNSRRADPGGVRFWTLPRVRYWTVSVVIVTALEFVVTLLVLADAVPDTAALRVVVLIGLGMVLGSLLTRAIVDTVEATRPLGGPGHGGSGHER